MKKTMGVVAMVCGLVLFTICPVFAGGELPPTITTPVTPVIDGVWRGTLRESVSGGEGLAFKFSLSFFCKVENDTINQDNSRVITLGLFMINGSWSPIRIGSGGLFHEDGAPANIFYWSIWFFGDQSYWGNVEVKSGDLLAGDFVSQNSTCNSGHCYTKSFSSGTATFEKVTREEIFTAFSLLLN